jgi:hypothetical protein
MEQFVKDPRFTLPTVLALLAIIIPSLFLRHLIYWPASNKVVIFIREEGNKAMPVPDIPLSPDPVVLFLNNERLADAQSPISIQEGKKIIITATVYDHQGRQVEDGSLTYRWCYNPRIEISLHQQHCLDPYYRGQLNADYTPADPDEQELTITINHPILNIPEVMIKFRPE